MTGAFFTWKVVVGVEKLPGVWLYILEKKICSFTVLHTHLPSIAFMFCLGIPDMQCRFLYQRPKNSHELIR